MIGGLDTNKLGGRKERLSTRDPFTQGLAIFDMTALRFIDQYTAAAPLYEQSDPVKQFYSQSPQ